jgi:23S rRNA pseudouridine1911/1915/1917 synthase
MAPRLQVLFEDNHIIIINKRPSDIVQGDKTGDTPLSEHVAQFLKEKYNKPGKAFIGVVHRLDRPVSGVVIFAKTSKALSRLNEMLRNKEIKKIYWAVVKNKPPEKEGHLIHYLKKNQEKNVSRAFDKEGKGALRGELKYTLKASSENYHLLEIELMTGRHHQIRAQLSAIGCPIKGDLKYGFPRSNPGASIHLHSRYCSFTHPVKDEKVEVYAPVPDDPLWKEFVRILG